MGKPNDIPQDVWTAADQALDNMLCNCIEASGSAEQYRIDSVSAIARAILAERERCAAVCLAEAKAFLSPEYASNQPLGSLCERFACEQCAAAIRKGGEA